MNRYRNHAQAIMWGFTLLAACLGWQAVTVADDEVLADDPAEAQAERQPHLVDLGSNFDANLFERHGNSWVIQGGGRIVINGQVNFQGGIVVGGGGANDRRPDSLALARARSAGKKRLERIDSVCRLSTEQKRRLELAIESDARRFAAEIDAVRDRYAGRQVNMNDQAGQKAWHAFQQDVQQCRERLRGLFDRGSLFATSLGRTLDERQLASMLEERAARRSYQWRALVAETLTRLDDTLALTREQHESIETLLVAREPPLRTDTDTNAFHDSNLRRHLVLMMLAEVDQKELRSTVSERQWRTLGNLTTQGRAMRSWIEQQGVLERRESESPPSRPSRGR
jgi:hypothetical protein